MLPSFDNPFRSRLSQIILIQFTSRLKCLASFNCFEGANCHGICECVAEVIVVCVVVVVVAVVADAVVAADVAAFILALLN